jgi:hypothetical protein
MATVCAFTTLWVEGAPVALVRAAIADGRDREIVVRQALDVGAAIMLHGAAKGTVDAVAAEVDRLLALLSERSSRIEALSRMRAQVSAAVGLGFEQSIGPQLDKCFAPFEDELEATGTTPGIADEKVGDFVVTLNPRDTGGRDRRIVFELKKRKTRASCRAAWQSLTVPCSTVVLRWRSWSSLIRHSRPYRAAPSGRSTATGCWSYGIPTANPAATYRSKSPPRSPGPSLSHRNVTT